MFRAMTDDDWDVVKVVNMVVNDTIRYQRLTADEKRKADAICQAYIHDEMSDSDDPFDVTLMILHIAQNMMRPMSKSEQMWKLIPINYSMKTTMIR
ncbi:hypothetical protein QE152_g14128 [Popillia japonica]|uniref:Uncharacterized protein n=1 Tax=Popillia japonica TaxID=7064 RepID=A0AAW1L9Z7_POPJA